MHSLPAVVMEAAYISAEVEGNKASKISWDAKIITDQTFVTSCTYVLVCAVHAEINFGQTSQENGRKK